jgi:hypothetical protein
MKRSNAGNILIPDFKLYYRVIVTKITWYWHKNILVAPQNRRPRNKLMQLQTPDS